MQGNPGRTKLPRATRSRHPHRHFRAPQGDIPASGNRIELRYATVKRVRDGRVASEHLYFDQLEFLQQLGALPAPSGGESAERLFHPANSAVLSLELALACWL